MSRLLKNQFPIFSNLPQPCAYLDSAATTQKPQSVIDAVVRFYTHQNSNIHRGAYPLADDATEAYEHAREVVRRFIGAQKSEEIIFTKGTTESINLVAQSWGRSHILPGDEILVTALEHHSNFLPWQQLAQSVGARLVIAPADASGRVSVSSVVSRLSAKTRLVALSAVSNVTGAKLACTEIIKKTHEFGARVLVDGAQAVGHSHVSVLDLDCDWYAFSGHKMYGPTGIGVLYGKQEVLQEMVPSSFGGGMVATLEKFVPTWAPVPERFEAGTPPLAEVAGLVAAISFLEDCGIDEIEKHETELTAYALEKFSALPRATIVGPLDVVQRAGIISFAISGIHAHDVGTLLAQRGVMVRAGQLCARPFFEGLPLPAVCRASFGVYTQNDDIDILMQGIEHACRVFSL